jgi:hypothetical protein
MRTKQGQAPNGFQNFSAQRVPTPSFHDEKHKQMLRNIEKSKKEEYEVCMDQSGYEGIEDDGREEATVGVCGHVEFFSHFCRCRN